VGEIAGKIDPQKRELTEGQWRKWCKNALGDPGVRIAIMEMLRDTKTKGYASLLKVIADMAETDKGLNLTPEEKKVLLGRLLAKRARQGSSPDT